MSLNPSLLLDLPTQQGALLTGLDLSLCVRGVSPRQAPEFSPKGASHLNAQPLGLCRDL